MALIATLCECGCGGTPSPGRRFVRWHHLPSGENHHSWQGENVGYAALHLWVAKHKVRIGVCEQCGAHPDGRGTEFANVSGEYRRHVDDYVELCNSCHKDFDQWPEKVRHPNKEREGA
jgi:hypothetical protein